MSTPVLSRLAGRPSLRPIGDRFVLLIIATVLALTGCASTSPSTSTGTPSAGGSAAGPSTASPTTIPTGQPTPSSAVTQLTGFFTAATREDAQLHAAAAMINAGVGTRTIRLTASTKAAVLAIDPAVAARSIPAGLGSTLQLAVLIVYSELKSRRMSMNRVGSWGFEPGMTVLTIGGYDATDLLSCLRNGAPAAAHFARDLAAARALATQTAQIAPQTARSRAAADLAVRIKEIDLGNSGCESCGGYVVTRLSTVSWHSQGSGIYHWDGVVGQGIGNPPGDAPSGSNTGGGISFRASYVATKGWQIELNAC